MALSGVEIFKLLPKTNCKKCGFPTCLAFAMKLAQRQASLDQCPDVSEEAKKILGEASAPPVRAITLGTGDRAVKMGEEIVLFRHEKKFFNPTVLAVEIKDTEDEATQDTKIADVLGSEIVRVGQNLRIDAICIRNEGDKGGFVALAKKVSEKAPQVPVIVSTEDPEAAKEAMAVFAGKGALLHGATEANLEAMASVAKEAKAALGLKAKGPEALAALTEKAKAQGVEDLVLDPMAEGPRQLIEYNTIIRRAAIKKNFKPLGYPTINFVGQEDKLYEALLAGLGIC
ncbi:MAG: acetyl-CoA decarbonylase/synthase complex subunit gamma, partial [Nitrospirae bacterium]